METFAYFVGLIHGGSENHVCLLHGTTVYIFSPPKIMQKTIFLHNAALKNRISLSPIHFEFLGLKNKCGSFQTFPSITTQFTQILRQN